jgi:hypothetical protein
VPDRPHLGCGVGAVDGRGENRVLDEPGCLRGPLARVPGGRISLPAVELGPAADLTSARGRMGRFCAASPGPGGFRYLSAVPGRSPHALRPRSAGSHMMIMDTSSYGAPAVSGRPSSWRTLRCCGRMPSAQESRDGMLVFPSAEVLMVLEVTMPALEQDNCAVQ